MKLSKFTDPKNPGVEHYLFYCPGCKHNHAYTVNSPKSPNWSFNGDMQRPTFQPSLLIYTSRPKRGLEKKEELKPEDWERHTLCHLFLTDGKIRYLDDCAHSLKGKIVDLLDLADGDY